MKTTGQQYKKFGRTAQNVGYQVQDMVIQISNGTDPLRSIGMQLPQMIVGMGALGAAIGIVGSVLPVMLAYMRDAESAAMEMDEAIDILTGTIGTLTEYSAGLDFNNWNKAWNEASAAVRQARLEILQFNVVASQAALNDSLKAMNEELEGGATMFQRWAGAIFDFLYQVDGAAEAMADERMMNELGVDRETVNQIQAINQEYMDGTITLEEMGQKMVALGTATDGASQEFYEMVRAVVALTEAEKKLEQARDQASAAGASIETGNPLPVDDKGKKSNKRDLTEEQRNFLADIRDMQETIKDLDNNKLAEEFDLATESVEIFERSFSSMADGLARGTQSIDDAFKGMVQSIVVQLGKLLAEWLTNQAIQALFGGGSGGVTANASGNVIQGGKVTPMAKGGIVSGPTIFPMAKGMGLMGEAGPEAVMPLTRMANGNLGVESSGINITVNNNVAGAEVVTRQTDQGLTLDIVMNGVAAAISRGGNVVSQSLEQSYALGRGRGVY